MVHRIGAEGAEALAGALHGGAAALARAEAATGAELHGKFALDPRAFTLTLAASEGHSFRPANKAHP